MPRNDIDIISETPMPDLSIANHGSILILSYHTEAGEEWIDRHIDPCAMTWGRNGIVVEPRHIDPIIAGAEDAGLCVGV